MNTKNINMNAFAVELYKRLASSDGNAIFSPSNIATMLGMLHLGAVGKTAEALEETLGVGLANGDLQEAFRESLKTASERKGIELIVSNALWVQEGIKINEGYENSIRSDYRGLLEALDFNGATEASRCRINEAVKEQTKGLIEELFDKGSVSPATVATLTAAIYFKGLWQIPFAKTHTWTEPFTLKNGEQIKVPIMYLIEAKGLRYYSGNRVQAVELPYQGGEMHMLLITSAGKESLAGLEAGLSVAHLDSLDSRMEEQEVTVFLPRFKVSSDFKLRDALEQMGMSVFGSKGDWSAMTQEHLELSGMVHKAVVNVDEEGTEAAAATGSELECLSVAKEFNGRQPFLYLIRDKDGNIHFMGKVENPSQA